MQGAVEQYWQAFLRETGRDSGLVPFECFGFGIGARMADELLALVLEGTKRATTSSVRGYELQEERLPRVGDLSVVLDGAGAPRCVIETRSVTILPFVDMTFDLCRLEGEDDSLASWRQNHIKFFSAEANALGYAFTEDMPVAFEEFDVVYR